VRCRDGHCATECGHHSRSDNHNQLDAAASDGDENQGNDGSADYAEPDGQRADADADGVVSVHIVDLGWPEKQENEELPRGQPARRIWEARIPTLPPERNVMSRMMIYIYVSTIFAMLIATYCCPFRLGEELGRAHWILGDPDFVDEESDNHDDAENEWGQYVCTVPWILGSGQ
jgi:hypothetical protein